jgi:hypothetical protein
MKTLKILLVVVAVILSGFVKDSQRTDAGVTKTVKFDGVIITNPSAGLTVCTPPAVPGKIPLIAHSRTGWLQGHQTHGGKLITELSTWELSSCNTDFATMLNTAQIEGVATVANGDSYSYTCIMTVNLVTQAVILNITITGGVGIYEGATGQLTFNGIHTESGIPVSGEGFLNFPK